MLSSAYQFVWLLPSSGSGLFQLNTTVVHANMLTMPFDRHRLNPISARI